MNIEISYYSSVGDRNINEDTVSVRESGNTLLALVADGLGGQGEGDTASQSAVASINSELQNNVIAEELMIRAIENANSQVFKLQNSDTRMMTTIAALWLQKHAAIVANVGDSRIYQIRDGKIIYQSVDHSVAQMAVYIGEITMEQVRGHQDRNKLVRALGSEKTVKTDCHTLSVKSGDYFLLCSDGFWEQVTEYEIVETLKSSESVSKWLEKMRSIIKAGKNSTLDNNSAIAIKTY